MEAVARLHAIAGVPVVVLLAGFAIAAAFFAATARHTPVALHVARRALLGLIVAIAATGLALGLRGAAPSETIHWLYGPLLVAALLVPAAIRADEERVRGVALAAGGVVATVLAWRLWSSG